MEEPRGNIRTLVFKSNSLNCLYLFCFTLFNVCVYVHMCEPECRHICAYMCRPKVNLICHSSGTAYFYWTQVSHWPGVC